MSKKQKKDLDNKKLLELRVSDGLTNLEEYTRMMGDEIDFNSFDVLSVSRVDTDEPYTKKFAHAHVETQVYRIASEESETLPFGINKRKLN